VPEDPIKLHEVLAAEYQTLRPGNDFSGAGNAEVYAKLHQHDQPLSALCISGGGIRSATFSLGIIQGLAARGLLERFDYLSTVSGGGYIGGWLTAWIHRFNGVEQVIPHLRPDAPAPGPGEPDPIEHLREYNNYLSPRLGFFSGDTWSLFATVGRNILLNWLVLVPLFMAALMVPRLLLSIARLGEAYKEIHGTADPIATSIPVVFGLPILSGLLLAMAVFNMARYLPGLGGRDHSQGDFLVKVLAPLVGAALCFTAFDSLYFWGDKDIPTTIPQLITWILVPSVLGWLAFLVVCGPGKLRGARGLIGSLSMGVLLMSVSTGIMAWLVTNKLLPPTSWAEYVTIAPPLLVLAFDLGGALFMGLASNVLEDEDREWLARASAWTQLFCVCWLGACGLVLLAPGWAFQWRVWAQSAFTAAGAISGWLSTQGSAPKASAKEKPGAGSTMSKYVLKLAPVVFVLTLVVGLSALTNFLLYQSGALFSTATDKGWKPVDWWAHDMLLEHTPWYWPIALGAMLYAMSWTMARYININKFSLHGMYRNRLIRAYLGASNPKRNASRFTGFSENDNLPMSALRTGFKPLHVVNLALNMVSGERLAWQQRKAQSFTVSPLYCGNFELGYRDSARFGGPSGISLGTAITISGAAASPNMGYHSSPMVGLIMTLLNARLGAWLGNPGVAGNDTWTESGPSTAIGSLVQEAFGLTTNTSAYVYLSDGGHFENLALYTMVLRRCRHIVVLDSGSDPTFTYEDLGNALRKIRIDLRIPIEFADDDIRPLRRKEKRCAVARIRYSEVDGPCEDGVLIYIKPILLGNEPPDVESYASAFPEFPHQSTADQWFNESQTESYRMLGIHTVEEICRGWDGKNWASFVEHVKGPYLQGTTAKSKSAAANA
jgi:Patatin-like phospholipase